MPEEVLGYVNVYRNEDGSPQLGATDLSDDVDEPAWAEEWQEFIGKAKVVLLPTAPFLAPAVGWRLVPEEPTPEMLGAFWRVKNGFHYADEPPPTSTDDVSAYRAMIAAAPAPSPDEARAKQEEIVARQPEDFEPYPAPSPDMGKTVERERDERSDKWRKLCHQHEQTVLDERTRAEAALRERVRDLEEALRAMPCYGCSTMPGDNSPDALRRAKGCITCRRARATLKGGVR